MFGSEHLGEMRMARLGGGQLRPVGALDQRAHPVDLRALVELDAQALDQPLDGVHGHGLGDDRLAPGRLLGQPRHVEIAIVRHQERARDRRRRHDQEVGAALARFLAALALQGKALVHAEAVLLVDDGERQVLELNVGLEQRMRADQDVDLAALQPLQERFARLALLAARQQRDGEAGVVGKGGDGLRVLARQHLGRRHQGRLRAGLHGDGHGHQRHHRLARPHVALQEPQHAVRRGHVRGDLLQRLALRAGEGEGQRIGNPARGCGRRPRCRGPAAA